MGVIQSKVVSFRLPVDLIEQIGAAAEAQGVARNRWVGETLRRSLPEPRKPDPDASLPVTDTGVVDAKAVPLPKRVPEDGKRHLHHYEKVGEPLRYHQGTPVYLWTCTGTGACGTTKIE